MLDVGCYAVQFATLVYGTEHPLKIIAGGHLKDGVDESTSTTLIYSGGRTATLLTHYGVQLPRDAYVIGSKGTLKVILPAVQTYPMLLIIIYLFFMLPHPSWPL